jgi:hypothetical protein
MFLYECELTCFRHDGAPHHFLIYVRQHLNQVFYKKVDRSRRPVSIILLWIEHQSSGISFAEVISQK